MNLEVLYEELQRFNAQFERLVDHLTAPDTRQREMQFEMPPKPDVTIDDCRAAMVQLTEAITRKGAKDWLVDQFGVERLADLAEDQYADLIYGANQRAKE